MDYNSAITLSCFNHIHIGELPEEMNSYDKLNERTILLHNTGRATQPWKSGLEIDYINHKVPKHKRIINKILGRKQFYINHPDKNQIGYYQITKEIIKTTNLIINTTPVGTYPKINEAPNIPYKYLDSEHLLFDLIYNPKETEFLKRGKANGCRITNGYKMLKYQAEKSWGLWSKKPEFY